MCRVVFFSVGRGLYFEWLGDSSFFFCDFEGLRLSVESSYMWSCFTEFETSYFDGVGSRGIEVGFDLVLFFGLGSVRVGISDFF